MKKLLRIAARIIIVLVLIPVAAILGVYFNYHLIAFSVDSRIYDSVSELPFRRYALVLGAGNYEPELWVNHSFNHRMHTVSELFRQHKCEKVIASGSRFSESYDEVAEMKLVLLQNGIHETAIIEDFGGSRTWESILQIREFHKVDSITIVSQRDQLERALFIAGVMGIDAIGVTASPSPKHNRYWRLREYLSRVKCVMDCVTFKVEQIKI